MTLHLTPEQAVALGLIDRKPPRGTRKTMKGAYHSRCCHCPDEFTTEAAETRHLNETGHTRFNTIPELETP